MIHLFILIALLNADQRELTVFINEKIPCENQLKKLLETENSLFLVNPKVFSLVNPESVKNNCKILDQRIKNIKQEFKIQFENRYKISKPYGVRFGFGEINPMPELDPISTISMIEYYIDLVYYDLAFELEKEKYDQALAKWKLEDYFKKHEFVKTLIKKNFTLENYIPLFSLDDDDMIPAPSQLPTKILDLAGKVRTLEDLGYKGIPKPKFYFRKKRECPILLHDP